MPSEQELQMIQILRAFNTGEDFSMLIERRLGTWDITLSSVLVGKSLKAKTHKARGTGATFDQAWDELNPQWA